MIGAPWDACRAEPSQAMFGPGAVQPLAIGDMEALLEEQEDIYLFIFLLADSPLLDTQDEQCQAERQQLQKIVTEIAQLAYVASVTVTAAAVHDHGVDDLDLTALTAETCALCDACHLHTRINTLTIAAHALMSRVAGAFPTPIPSCLGLSGACIIGKAQDMRSCSEAHSGHAILMHMLMSHSWQSDADALTLSS